MKNALMEKTKAAIIKIGSFINENYELLLFGVLISAIVMHDTVMALVLILVIFYAKLSEIATSLTASRRNLTHNLMIVTNAPINSIEVKEGV